MKLSIVWPGFAVGSYGHDQNPCQIFFNDPSSDGAFANGASHAGFESNRPNKKLVSVSAGSTSNTKLQQMCIVFHLFSKEKETLESITTMEIQTALCTHAVRFECELLKKSPAMLLFYSVSSESVPAIKYFSYDN